MNINYEEILLKYGKDILTSDTMQMEKQFYQHGNITVYEHSIAVACICIWLVEKFHLKVDERSLVRGALLHDYFLYDWHVADKSHRLHGFSHAKTALENATRDFKLNKVEKDMIRCHMFPMNLRVPKYKESRILCFADKLSATMETIYIPVYRDITRRMASAAILH